MRWKEDQNGSLSLSNWKRWNKALTIYSVIQCLPDYCYIFDVKCYFFLSWLHKKTFYTHISIHSLNLVHWIWVSMCVCVFSVCRFFLKVLKGSQNKETNNNNKLEKKKKLNRAHFVRCIVSIRYNIIVFFFEKRRVYCQVILLVFCFIDFWLLDTASWCFDLRLIFSLSIFVCYSTK